MESSVQEVWMNTFGQYSQYLYFLIYYNIVYTAARFTANLDLPRPKNLLGVVHILRNQFLEHFYPPPPLCNQFYT